MVERYRGQVPTSLTFSTPQSWMLDRDVVSGTVRMIRTGSCRVRCLKPDGTPAPGVIVGFSPNHYFHGAGSQLFAISYRSTDLLKERSFQGRPFQRHLDHEYLGTTGPDGWATIANLPACANSFEVLDHRVAGETQGRRDTVTVELDKVAETTVTIEPLPN
jgi:hypothetical protein